MIRLDGLQVSHFVLILSCIMIVIIMLQRHSSLPSHYISSIQKIEEQQQRFEQIRRVKQEKIIKTEEVSIFSISHSLLSS